MDIVYISDLRIDTTIGIFDWERRVRQTLSVDLEMATDIRRAAGSDDIQYALDYSAVSQRIIQLAQDSQFLLIEAMAEAICQLLREEFQVPWVKLRLGKPGAVREARDVGLLIERGERP